jgi:DNA repair ATPase RecN
MLSGIEVNDCLQQLCRDSQKRLENCRETQARFLNILHDLNRYQQRLSQLKRQISKIFEKIFQRALLHRRDDSFDEIFIVSPPFRLSNDNFL